MSKSNLKLVAAPMVLALCTTTPGVNHLVAQEHTRQSASEAPATTLDDPTIVAIFDNANSADIETGNLAAKRGSTKEVRQFGAMLARDHAMVRQQGRVWPRNSASRPPRPRATRARGIRRQ